MAFALKTLFLTRRLKSCSTAAIQRRRGMARMLSDPENKGSRQEHVNFDTLGTWDNRIDFEISLRESIKQGRPIPAIHLDRVAATTVLGRRTTNEDQFIFQEIRPYLLCLAVFDGHGGGGCAEFCAAHMLDLIVHWIERGEQDLSAILNHSFIELNNLFSRHVTFSLWKGVEYDQSGTTATVALLRNSTELVVGHVGDSRAILCRNGEPIRLTVDHSADIKNEKERILGSGGTIRIDEARLKTYVNGRLGMTRSLGDHDLKRVGVIPVPDTRHIQLSHGRDAFLVLTTDGITDALTDSEVVHIACQCGTPREAVQLLTDQALHYGCQDNATALVLPLGAWGKFKTYANANASVNHFHFGRELHKSSRF